MLVFSVASWFIVSMLWISTIPFKWGDGLGLRDLKLMVTGL